MRFHGLSEPPIGRICSSASLSSHVGAGFLGPISSSEPLVEIFAVALSEDEQHLMVMVHAATEVHKFVGTAHVTVAWYARQFETHTFLRGAPEDLSALDVVPCIFVEGSRNLPSRSLSFIELVGAELEKLARDLGQRWLEGKQPMRRTEHFFLALLTSDSEDIKRQAHVGLSLLAEALNGKRLSSALRVQIGKACLDMATAQTQDAEPPDPPHVDEC